MFRSYFRTAWRNLLKNRQFTFLNLTGLSIGLCCTLLIWLWVYDELTFDRFHENNARLFQVMEHRTHAEGIRTTKETSPLLAEALAAAMPEVEYATASTPSSWFPGMALTVGDKTVKAATLFAGKDYFNIFSYPLSAGNRDQVLANRNGAVISRKLAMELFHTSGDVTGRTFAWQIDSTKRYCVVSGVFEGTPANSSTQFDVALPFDVFKDIMNIRGSMDAGSSWGPFLTYVMLKKGADAERFNARLGELVKSRSGVPRNMFLKPYADNYLYGNYENGYEAGGRISYVRLFSLIAIFILVIACINFMNLSTAKAAGRMKEIGVRKTIGASRRSLVMQYLGESLLIAFLAMILALAMIMLSLPAFNNITGKALVIRADVRLWLSFAGITLIAGLLAGSYPALYLSRFRPVAVLKGHLHKVAGEVLIRKGLVVFQFSMSVIFIVAVLVVHQQVHYVQSKFPGYTKDNVIYFNADGKARHHLPAFLAEIRKLPGVANASSMVGNIVTADASSVGIRWQDEVIMFRPFLADYDLIETLGMEMIAGRAFSRQFPSDTGRIILNEAAVKAMGLTDPAGKVIRFGGQDREIAGVVRNFNFQSLHETVKPLFLKLDAGTSTVLVKIKAGREKEVLDRLKAFYASYNPGFSFEHKFLEEDYEAQYAAEKRVAVLSRYFAGLAVFISCLGLFGLVAFTAERRRREIGIRKVLGATVGNVLMILSGDFLKAVLLAILIAVPLAWWALSRWLDGFAYHIRMEADTFLVAGGAMILITLLTVSFQAIRAAMANPVKSLKTE